MLKTCLNIPGLLLLQSSKESNILTVGAWGNPIKNSKKMYIYTSIRNDRYSYKLIEDLEFFSLSFVDEKNVKLLEYCGTVSKEKKNKLNKMKIKTYKKDFLIPSDCIFSYLCIPINIVQMPYHKLIIGEVQYIYQDENFEINKELIINNPPFYYKIGNKIGE